MTRGVVGLATRHDAGVAISRATSPRGDGTQGRARARAAVALVLSAHASARDAALWPDGGSGVDISARLAMDVKAALGDVCHATAAAELPDLPEQLADLWNHAKSTAPRLSVVALRRQILHRRNPHPRSGTCTALLGIP